MLLIKADVLLEDIVRLICAVCNCAVGLCKPKQCDKCDLVILVRLSASPHLKLDDGFLSIIAAVLC